MPVHMRYEVASHRIVPEEARGEHRPHGRTGSIRILQEGGSRFTGLFEKTVRLTDVPVKFEGGDGEERMPIKANRGSIIDYLEAHDALESRRFIFGAKGLFGIGLLGTGLSNQEIQELFNQCVQGKERQSQPPAGGGEDSNALPPLPSGHGAFMPPGVKRTSVSTETNLLVHLTQTEPNSRVKILFEEEDSIPDCFQTYYTTPKEGGLSVVVHMRVVDRQPQDAEWERWYTQLEHKLAGSRIQQFVVYPSDVENYKIEQAWRDMQVAYRRVHKIDT